MMLERFHQRIHEKSTDRSAAPALIVALGDSVTQGIGGIDELYHDDVYHARLKRKLEAVTRYAPSASSMRAWMVIASRTVKRDSITT
jgi:hypothetical protein